MAKRKKTRREKILAETKRQAMNYQIAQIPQEKQHFTTHQPQTEFQSPTFSYTPTDSQSKALNSRDFTKDLRKTVVFTGVIMMIEVLIKLFL